jgi:Uma2 family endonuclease
VQEYWIADWRLQQVEVYRREEGRLRRVATLLAAEETTSALLPGFAGRVARFFD